MKIGVIGSRTFSDYTLLEKTLNQFKSIDLIVSGGAKGADLLSEKYAKEYNINTLIHYPDWNEHGRMAGFVRNSDIVNDSDIVIAFWDKKSKGTRDSIKKCHNKNTPVYIIFYLEKYD